MHCVKFRIGPAGNQIQDPDPCTLNEHTVANRESWAELFWENVFTVNLSKCVAL